MIRIGLALALALCGSAASPADVIVESDTARVSIGPVWHAPVPDVASLLARDAERAGQSGPLRIAEPFAARLTPSDSGRWRVESDGDHVWTIELRAPGALWTGVGFDRFGIPQGAEVVVRQTDGAQVRGPYDGSNAYSGQLWVPPIEGPSATVELTWPATLGRPEPGLRIGTVSHGYRPWSGGGAKASETQAVGGDTCDIDVNCPLGDDWQDEKRGIVRLVIANTVACTGSLINTTALDCEPLVLTGDHCYDDGGTFLTPAATNYFFEYERPSCGGVGELEQNIPVVMGSELVARNDPTDFRIHRLPSLPAGTDLYFNGWNRSAATPQETWTIHHPLGDFKKIAHNVEPVTESGVNFWRVNSWEEGSMANGSSGCPLFDADGSIVGQLFAGTILCDAPTELADFGKLNLSWAQGLSVILDPLGTGPTTLPGMDDDFCGNPAPRLAFSSRTVDDSQGNVDGIADPGDIMRLEVELANGGPVAASQVVASLISTGPGVTVLDALSDYPNVSPNATAVSTSPHFTIDIDPALDCGSLLPFTMGIESSQGAWVSQFGLQTGTRTGFEQPPTYFDDMESGLNGWIVDDLIGSNSWVQVTTQSQSPTHSWFVNDVGVTRDSALIMPPSAIGPVPAGAVLRFSHRYDTELGGDGGVLEYSTDGGTWFDAGELIVTGGYNGAISKSFQSPLSGRDAWTGDNGGFETAEVDLSLFEGGVVLFRWRFATDQFSAGAGWWLDDVSVERGTFDCKEPHFRLFPGALCRGHRINAPESDFSCGAPRPMKPSAHDRMR